MLDVHPVSSALTPETELLFPYCASKSPGTVSSGHMFTPQPVPVGRRMGFPDLPVIGLVSWGWGDVSLDLMDPVTGKGSFTEEGIKS